MTRPDDDTLLPECVEPALGRERWRLADPDLDPAERRRLEAHLVICDACRLDQAVDDRVAATVRAGALAPGASRGPRRWLAGSLVATAAALALFAILPPRPQGPAVVPRGDTAARILRPVEGQVVATARPTVAWTSIAGATAYRVEVEAVGGAYRWSGRVQAPRLALPPGAALPGPGRYRVLIDPVPADLAPPGALSVSFTRSGWLDAAAYRGRAAPRPVQAFLLLGLTSTVLAAFRLRRTAAA